MTAPTEPSHSPKKELLPFVELFATVSKRPGRFIQIQPNYQHLPEPANTVNKRLNAELQKNSALSAHGTVAVVTRSELILMRHNGNAESLDGSAEEIQKRGKAVWDSLRKYTNFLPVVAPKQKLTMDGDVIYAFYHPLFQPGATNDQIRAITTADGKKKSPKSKNTSANKKSKTDQYQSDDSSSESVQYFPEINEELFSSSSCGSAFLVDTATPTESMLMTGLDPASLFAPATSLPVDQVPSGGKQKVVECEGADGKEDLPSGNTRLKKRSLAQITEKPHQARRNPPVQSHAAVVAPTVTWPNTFGSLNEMPPFDYATPPPVAFSHQINNDAISSFDFLQKQCLDYAPYPNILDEVYHWTVNQPVEPFDF